MLTVTSIFFLSACSEKRAIEHFPSKEEALKQLVQKENVKGRIDLLTTTNGENVVVIQSSENTYLVGELVKDKEGYYAGKISASSELTTVGASWELTTIDNNEYTIKFKKSKEGSNNEYFSIGEYDISLVKGHTLSDKKLASTSAIKVVERMKD
ncbi:hypothetical protein HNO89_003127 [Sporosarcina luteola]|nr:hypothetical protein [Sporosarcina luteola]